MGYWEKRLIDEQQLLCSLSINKTEAMVQKIYKDAINSTLLEISKLYDKITGNDGVPRMNDLYRYNRYFDLIANLNKRLVEVGGQEQKIYNRQFIGLYDRVQDEIGHSAPPEISFINVAPGSAENMVKSVWCADGKHWSSRVWEDKQLLQKSIEKTLVDCVARGVSKDEVIKEVKANFGVSFNNADRLIRTELNHVMNQSATDRYIAAGCEYYEYLAADDSRTCSKCKELDGKIFNFKEAIIGVNMPPLHPNTRSTIKPIIGGHNND